jgi:hypothetical protein
MSKIKAKKKRSWLTTILGGVVAIISFYFAFAGFKPTVSGFLFTIATAAFGTLATIIAVQGKPKTLRELIESWFYF